MDIRLAIIGTVTFGLMVLGTYLNHRDNNHPLT